MTYIMAYDNPHCGGGVDLTREEAIYHYGYRKVSQAERAAKQRRQRMSIMASPNDLCVFAR